MPDLRPLLILALSLAALTACNPQQSPDNRAGDSRTPAAQGSAQPGSSPDAGAESSPEEDRSEAGRSDDAEIRRLTEKIEQQDNPVEPLRKRAARYMNLGDRERALADLERALELAPEHFVTRMRAGSVMLDLDRLEGAEQHFRSAAEAKPGSAEPLRMQARVHMRQMEVGAAEEALRRALERNPASGAALSDLIGLRIARGSESPAEDLGGIIESFLAAGSSPARANWRVGDILHRAGRTESAAEYVGRALELEAGRPTVHWTMGLIERDRGDMEAALEHYDRALALYEGADRQNEQTRLDRRKLLELISEAHRELDQYQPALDAVMKLLEEDGANSRYQLERARLREQLGEEQRAAGTFERIRKQHPRLYRVWMAQRRLNEKDYRGALEELDKIGDRRRGTVQLERLRYRAQMGLERYQEALETAGRLAEAGTGARALILRARALAELGRTAEARSACREALQGPAGMEVLTDLPGACRPIDALSTTGERA